jgi:hypothetical protein
VILAVHIFGDEATGTGLLNSAIGVGGVIGAVFAGVLVLRRRLAPPLLDGGAGMAAGLVILGLVPQGALTFALAAMAITSAGALLVEIVARTLLQRIVPDAVRGRTLGIMETISISAFAAGSFVLPLIAADDPAAALVACAVLIVVAAVAGVVLLGHYSIQRPPDDARQLLARVAILAGLPPARLETAISRSVLRSMSPGESIIRQGDPADFFYVIVDGTVEVSQTDTGGHSSVLRQMGRLEYFGEIGLLSRVPRTASVTALTEGTLIALDKGSFLELVEAGPGLTYRLLDVHRVSVQQAEG